MRGYSTISDEERNSILQQHSSFYNGYAVGNVPNEPQPLRVGKGASDPNGITVDNKGNVKTYQNHKINESVVSEDVNENEDILKNYKALIGFVQFIIDKGGENKSIEEASALSELSIYYENLRDGITPKTLSKEAQISKQIVEKDIIKFNDAQIKKFEKNGGGETRLYEMDMDISDEESAYSFKSDGPEQFDSSYSDDSYGLDIDSIMQMFGGDMSPAEYDDMDDMMNSHMDGKEKFHDEDEAYEFDSEGGDAAVYYEEEQCEGCGSEMEEGKEVCEQCGGEMMEGECMECGSLYEEIDEDLHESFNHDRKLIKDMFNRFNKFN